MRLLISWVREFVDVKASPEEIAAKLALRGFEVASIEPFGEPDGLDGVVDFEVTANRPDCLSVLGFAREIATAYGLPIRLPSAEPDAPIPLTSIPTGESDRLKVTLEDATLCPRYAAAVAEVAPAITPTWMSGRLQAAGLRSISPFVDITNYVLMELGHPMHAFDLAKLAGAEIRIRTARPGEVITTLDGIERKLDTEMLVIADSRRAQAIGGVMGAADSEVSGSTRTIALESACFKPASVRRTSKRLGLKTDASSRFERGADINAPVLALQRALALMQRIGAGRVIGPLIDRYPVPRGPVRLRLRRARLASLLGMSVPDGEVARILAALGLGVETAPDGWEVVVPTFRVDLAREVDLIEEVGRHFGFDKLEPTFPPMRAPAPAEDWRILRDRLVRRTLTANGLSEAVTFGFIEAEAARTFVSQGEAAALVSVANPLSATFDTLRPSLMPGLVDAVSHNRRHGRRDVRLFEIGTRFTATDGETRGVGLAWTGAASGDHWSSAPREIDFFDAKGVVEELCAQLGASTRFVPLAVPFLVAGQAARILVADRPVGLIGLVAPAVVERRGAPRQDRVFVAELDLDRLDDRRAPGDERVRPLARYPAVVRDLSIVVSDALPAEIIRGTIQSAAAAAPAPLVADTFFDRYTGKGVPDDSVSLSIRLTFQAFDRTLTDADVQQSFDRILAALVREHGAVQR
jgi:phenylalanyl-tRNA synthetase beta chain